MQLLNDFKPVGAFIENTVRPIISELKDLGIELDIAKVEDLFTKVAIAHVMSTFITALKDIIIVCTIGYLCLIYRL